MRSRSYLLTIPYNYNEKVVKIKDVKEYLKDYDYIVYQLEKGETTGFKHYQLYLENEEPIRFDTLKNKIPFAHIEQRKGTKKQAFDYCTKKDSRLHGPWEIGERPTFNDKNKKNGIKEQFIQAVSTGATDMELLLNYPTIFSKKLVNEIRDVLHISLNQENRNVNVHYIFGGTGLGKSSFVRRVHKASEIYVVSDYERDPFGGYTGQKVIIFEEYRSNFPLSVFLQYLDIYPLSLPARYQNKQALYTDVYIISNWALEQQYYNLCDEDKKAFYRRIKYRYVVTKDYIFRSTFDNLKFVKKEWVFNPFGEEYKRLDELPFDYLAPLTFEDVNVNVIEMNNEKIKVN